MSTIPRELPGFYYDEERRRYFPLTQSRVQQVKRAQINTTFDDKNDTYWKKCAEVYNNYNPRSEKPIPFNPNDLPLIGRITDLRTSGANMFKNVLKLSPKELVGSRGKNEPYNPFVFHNGNLFRIPLSDCTVLDFEVANEVSDWESSTYSSGPSGNAFTPERENIEIISIKKVTPKYITFHYSRTYKHSDEEDFDDSFVPGTNVKHVFQLLEQPNEKRGNLSRDTPKSFKHCSVILNAELSANVRDSVFTSSGPILAMQNQLICLRWSQEYSEKFIKLPSKSDITALQCYQRGGAPYIIFCGMRNGHIYGLKFNSPNNRRLPTKDGMVTIKGLHGISSVVSFHSFRDGGLLVSAIKKNTAAQHLMIVDTLGLESSAPESEASVVFLKTKFHNAAKDSEYLDISENEQFVLYGKGEDFEVFSLHHREYEKDDKYICYPFASFKDYIKNDQSIDMKRYRLSNVAFSSVDKAYQDMYSFSLDNHTNLKLQYRVADEFNYQENLYQTTPLIVMTFKLIERDSTDMDTPIMITACVYVV